MKTNQTADLYFALTHYVGSDGTRLELRFHRTGIRYVTGRWDWTVDGGATWYEGHRSKLRSMMAAAHERGLAPIKMAWSAVLAAMDPEVRA